VEIPPNYPVLTTFRLNPSCEKSVWNSAEPLVNLIPNFVSAPGLHNFHISFTAMRKEDLLTKWKTPNGGDLSA